MRERLSTFSLKADWIALARATPSHRSSRICSVMLYQQDIEWMKSCRRRASIVVPQGFATGAYAMSAKEKAIACSSIAAGHRSG